MISRIGHMLNFGFKGLMKLVLTPVVLLCAAYLGIYSFLAFSKDFLVDMYVHEQMPWD